MKRRKLRTRVASVGWMSDFGIAGPRSQRSRYQGGTPCRKAVIRLYRWATLLLTRGLANHLADALQSRISPRLASTASMLSANGHHLH